MRARAARGGLVARVEERAGPERQAAAADAGRQPAADRLQDLDPLGELACRVEQNIAAAQKKEQESIAAIEERLRKLELAAQAQPAIPATVNTGAASEAPAPQPAESPQRTYEAAMNSYRASDYQGAIDGFTGFLRQYPQHALSANAQYWIGDAHFQLRDYKSAIEAQRKLLSTYPDSAKVPDALLNIGSAELGLGDPVAARKTWDDLIARHPSSDAADKARQRLSRLR